ncbi:MAG: hypothetical protein KF724_06385 [Phycisphaeraceae bacterium]|nr:hypothetical protein [Phycisphaeraceae bacterium]
MPRQSRRVAISGIGPITPFGLGIDPLWSGLCEGRSLLGPALTFDSTAFPCPFVGAIPADRFDVKSVVPKSYRKGTKVMARDIELAVGAAHAAMASAGVVTKASEPADGRVTIPPDRFGCHIGAGLIAAEENELTAALATAVDEQGRFTLALWGSRGMENLTPLWMLKYLPNMLACHVTIIHDCQGPSNTITCAEVSGLLSMGESMRVIERGDADACLSGGAESKVNLMALLRQHFAGRTPRCDSTMEPASLVRPFAADAVGCPPGEGGGLLILEAEEALERRGGRAIASLEGFGASQSLCMDDAGIQPDAEGVSDAIAAALDDANADIDSIDAIVPFGSGVPVIDSAERQAIATVFGPRAKSIPIVTVTPSIGNCGAGAGAIAACVAVECLRRQALPARLNTRGVTDLDANAAPTRSASLNRVLVVLPSFGGQNGAIVLGRVA